MVRGAPSAPIVSGKKGSATAKRAMLINMDRQMAQMKAIIKKMQQQIKRFWAATDPKERRKLMQVHMQTLKESMKRMRSMAAR
jgi:hypothetical protein